MSPRSLSYSRNWIVDLRTSQDNAEVNDIQLRRAGLADAAEIARIRVENSPFIIFDAEIVRHRMRNTLSRQRELDLVAALDGHLVAWAAAGLDLEGGDKLVNVNVQVDRRYRRLGAGTRLCQTLLEHAAVIGAKAVKGRYVNEDYMHFARRHGFTQTRVERVSHLSLDTIPDVEVPPGFEFVPASQLDTAGSLYEIDDAVAGDIPSDGQWSSMPYTQWQDRYLADGRLNWYCTVLAFHGDTPAGVEWLDSIVTRVWSGLTGTKPQFRGRGLAKALKVAALRRARDRGFGDAYTSNDSGNAAILAVNNWLGYRPYTDQLCCLKSLR